MGRRWEAQQDCVHTLARVHKRARVSFHTVSQLGELMILVRRQGDYEEARSAFTKAAKFPLDWPEMLWEAWLAFEHSHGSVGEIQAALDSVERAKTQVEARRAKVLIYLRFFVRHAEGFFKEAEQAGYQAMQVTTSQQAAHVPVTGPTEATHEIETPMDVDREAKDTRVKRKAEEEPLEESKKARVGVCSLVNCLREHPLKLSRTTPDSQAVRTPFRFFRV